MRMEGINIKAIQYKQTISIEFSVLRVCAGVCAVRIRVTLNIFYCGMRRGLRRAIRVIPKLLFILRPGQTKLKIRVLKNAAIYIHI